MKQTAQVATYFLNLNNLDAALGVNAFSNLDRCTNKSRTLYGYMVAFDEAR